MWTRLCPLRCKTSHICQCVQNEADVKTSAHSNALAKACAWVEQRGGWAGALLAGATAVVGVELLKRCASSALGPIIGHHSGAETGHDSQHLRLACCRPGISMLAFQSLLLPLLDVTIVRLQWREQLGGDQCRAGVPGASDSFGREELKRMRRHGNASERRRIQCEVANEVS